MIRLGLFLATLACLPMAHAQADSEVLTPHDLSKVRTVRQVVISPDGQNIAYTLSVPREAGQDDDGPARSELHIVNRESGQSRPFIVGDVSVSSLDWLPDSAHVSFLTKREGDKKTSLYVIPIGGGEARRAVGFESNIGDYSWNRDGTKVAFIAVEPEPADVKKRKDQGFKQEIYEEDYRHRRIYIAKAFSDEEPRQIEVEGSFFDVEWSPIDDRLATALSPTPLVDDSYMSKRVRVVDSESSKVLASIENPGKLGELRWSPDGQSIAMISAETIHDAIAGRLKLAPSSGGTPKDILPSPQSDIDHIAWQDAQTIMYLESNSLWTRLGKLARDGGKPKILKEDMGAAMTSLSLSKDGQHAAFVAHTAKHPAEVYTMSHGDDGPRRLTDSNPWMRDIRLAKQEVVKYTARDGLEIHGLLIRPLDEVPGTKYPMIVVVHGGPESHYDNGWITRYSTPGQIAAAQGFAVFYPNYRGSTGRGVKFCNAGQRDFAGAEFDDVVDGVEHIVKTGLVDKSKVGVTGGSYGGYATGWCATRHSKLFAAGVMFVGISNKISKVGTTDIPNEEYLVHARMRPWDNWQLFLERSPIYYAGDCKTPLLILHGKDDPRVNVGQSRELYRHVKLRTNTPVRLVLYPGEGHGNRKAAAQLDYSLRSLRWMSHYLKGDGGAAPSFEIDYANPAAKSTAD